jgi:hypothetical protein
VGFLLVGLLRSLEVLGKSFGISATFRGGWNPGEAKGWFGCNKRANVAYVGSTNGYFFG